MSRTWVSGVLAWCALQQVLPATAAAAATADASATSSSASSVFQESDWQYWIQKEKQKLSETAKLQLSTNNAKNLIMFLGDGMSLTTLTAARIYKGQLHNMSGESEYLSFEKFPFTGISKTYCVDRQVPDSACTATAYLCGVKNNIGTIGVTSKVPLADCPASVPEDRRVTSIMQWAQWAGKATGIVTTTRVTDASPAGAYANTADRNWESDNDMLTWPGGVTNRTLCEDIAGQLIRRDPGRNFKVIMGGGRSKMLPKTTSGGQRADGEDLVQVWSADKRQRFGNATAAYVTDRQQLMETDMSKVDFVLGLFQDGHMNYRLKSNAVKQPTLREMTGKAVQLLRKEPNGFVLFVEGGLIDKAHHETWAKIALDETVEFSDAVAEAARMTDEQDTLIVVTSDHAHTVSMAGYPKRGANILGTTEELADDGMTYTTLSYANGPKSPYQNNDDGKCRRINVTGDNFDNVEYRYPSLVDIDLETHGGDDVMVFARGPWAHLFTGNFEQNRIPLAMAMAAGLSTDPPTSERSAAARRFDLTGPTALATLLLTCLAGIFRSIY